MNLRGQMRVIESAEEQSIVHGEPGYDEARAHLDSARAYLVEALQSLDSIDGRSHLAARCQELIDLIDGE